MARKPLNPEQQRKLATALEEHRQDTISSIGGSAKALAIGNKDVAGPNSFGVKIQPSVLAIKGRILPAPSVEYDGATFKPDFGSWNLKEKRRFATGAGIKRWTCLQIQIAGKDRPVAGLDGFVLGLQKVYESTICGSARSHQSVTLKGTSPEYLFDTLDRFFGKVREKDIDTLLVILPDKRQTLFACIKYLADVKHGMRTICIEASTLQKHIKESWYAATIAQKLNIRGGGVNQRLAESELETLLVQPTMIVGIDVIKPFPRGDINTATSLIGVVASMDRDCAQWPASVRQQENPDKVDHDLQEMMTERLNLWKKANGKLPSRLLIYRNGVTSSHDTVMAKEAKSISDALSSTYSRQALPKVTFMTISKSHHTRFYPADRKAADGQTGNPKAGTVFDRDITGTGPWDFYLQSHPGTPKSGTVCPAHYVVVKDDMGLGADGVQKLTNNLCYLSARGTRALSIVPPAHYANLVCERARCYVQASLIPGGSGNVDSGGRMSVQWTEGVHPELRDSMWYI